VIGHPKSKKVSPLLATKTVKHLLGRADRERRILFRMKGTEAQKILSRPFKLDKLAYQLDDIDSPFDLFFGRLMRVHTRY